MPPLCLKPKSGACLFHPYSDGLRVVACARGGGGGGGGVLQFALIRISPHFWLHCALLIVACVLSFHALTAHLLNLAFWVMFPFLDAILSPREVEMPISSNTSSTEAHRRSGNMGWAKVELQSITGHVTRFLHGTVSE